MNSGHHKTIFSKRLGCLVAVGEHASSQGKANGAASGQFSGSAGTDWLSTVLQFVGVLTASCALVTLAWAGPVASTALPNSLPTGGQVAQGAASISQSGAVMNITQSTPKAVVNWNTFDIGQNAKVNIVQPGADAVMLNRVTSANPSQILGQLNANGQVVLVNPNGVLFGKDGSVNANSFTASTLGITDANFMAGNQQFERNGSTATVVNQGRINTTGGYVALLGASVSNEGQINTQGGTAYLAAAETVKIPVSGSGRIKLELSPSRINAAVANGKTGTIVTEGGQLYMQAASLSTMVASIIQSGNIDTTGAQGGAVHLLADGGTIKVDGSITANSTDKDEQGQHLKGGDIVIGRDIETGALAKATDVSGAKLESDKGFVETSGEFLKTDGIQVKASEWLLDPNDIVIGAADTTSTYTNSSNTFSGGAATSFIGAATLGAALTAGTSVTVKTSSGSGGNGDITVNTAVTAVGNGTLKLQADRNLAINANIDTKGGDTQLQTKGGQITLANNVVITGNNISLDTTNGTIDTVGAITAGGSVTSANAITLNTGSKLLATNNLNMRANAGGANNTLTLNGTLQAKTITGDFTSSSGSSIVMSGATITTLADGGSSKLSGIHTATTGPGALVSGLNSITAATGTDFTLTSNSSAVTAAVYSLSRGLRIDNGSITTNGTVTIEGKSSNSDGILMITSGGLKNTGGTLTVKGSSTGSGGGGVNGINFQGNAFIQGTTSTANLKITGFTANSSASVVETGAALTGAGGIVGAGGTLDLTGYSSSGSNSSGLTVGTAISGWGTTNIVGQNLRASSGDAINLNAAVSSTGNMTIQSIGGRVNQIGGSLSAGRLTIDNTGAGLTGFITDAGAALSAGTSMGGAIDATTGIVTSKGTGKSNAGQHGLNLQAAINTIGALYLSGETAAALGSGVNGISVNGIVGATGGVTFDAASDALIAVGGTLSGGTGNVGGLTKAGSGKLTLSTANAMKGVTLVGAGTLALNNVNALQMSTLHTGTSGAQQVTFALTGANTYNIGALQGADNLVIGSNTISVGGNNTSTTYTGAISGTGNFTKAGTGTQVLTGTNLYSGTTAVNAGTLQIGDATTTGTLGAGAVTIASGATLNFKRSNAYDVTNAISGAGQVLQSGAGTTSLNSATTYTGASTVQAGTLKFTNGSKSSAYAISSGATAEFNVTSGTLDLPTSTISGAGTLKKTGNGTVVWAGGAGTFNMSAGGLIDVNAGTFVGGNQNNEVWTNNKSSLNVNSGAVFQGVEANVIVDALTGDGSVQTGWNGIGGSISVGVNGTLAGLYNSAGSAVFSGVISNYAGQTAGGLIKTGIGTQILTGNNSYSGTTSVTGGTLQIGNAGITGTLGAGAVSVASGASLNFNRSDSTTVANTIGGAGAVSQNGSGVGSTSNVTFTGDLSAETGAFNVNRGTMTLSAAGTNRRFNGSAININNGSTVKITSTGGYYYAFGTTWNFDTNGGGTIDASPTVNFAMGYLTASANNTFNTNGGATNNIIGAYTGGINTNTASSTTTFNVAPGSSTVGLNVSADFWNAGSIVKTGAGLMQLTNVTLDATTGFTGAIAVNQGTLQVGNGVTSGYLGSGKVTLSNNANLNYLRSAATTINNEIVGTGNVNATIGNALTVNKAINLTDGKINLVTDNGNVQINQAVSTGSTASDAIFIEAGKSTAAGTASGGDVKLAGSGSITATNGRAIIMTGSVSGSGNSGNLGVTAGNNRYGSDELTNGYNTTTAALGTTGKYAIYREAPTISARINNDNKTYDGQGYSGSAGVGRFSGLQNGDTDPKLGVISYSSGINASNTAYALNGSAISGLGYVVSLTPGELTISKAVLTATGNSSSVIYNGANQSVSGFTVTGLQGTDTLGDLINVSAFGATGKNAGSYSNTVTAGVETNYTVNTVNGNLVIGQLALTANISSVSTQYGTVAATGVASLSGVLVGDDVKLTGFAKLVDATSSTSGQLKVGTYQQSIVGSLTGADSSNYTVAPTSLANYVVTPKAIVATVTAADKVYDGNNVATLNANSAGILTGDVVNVLGATGTFASKNVARDGSGNVVAQTVTVTGTGVGLGGTDGANYTLTNATSIASTTAKITPKDLSVSGITAIDKVYDGSTAAAINSANAVLAGLVTGDSVSVSTQSGVGNFASKDVAFDGAGVVASQAVTVSGLSLNGAAAGNYNVSDKSGAKAKVLQRALSITGSVAQDKTVDGNTNAQVKPGQLVNLVAGESLVVSATGQFADAEIGTNKAVTTQYALANGANGVARNYTLAGEVLRAAILVASINPVQPIVNPSRTSGGGRVVVSGSGNSGAALGVADGEEEIISREECSVLNPEKCECQESTIAGVEMCFAPTLAANTKN